MSATSMFLAIWLTEHATLSAAQPTSRPACLPHAALLTAPAAPQREAWWRRTYRWCGTRGWFPAAHLQNVVERGGMGALVQMVAEHAWQSVGGGGAACCSSTTHRGLQNSGTVAGQDIPCPRWTGARVAAVLLLAGNNNPAPSPSFSGLRLVEGMASSTPMTCTPGPHDGRAAGTLRKVACRASGATQAATRSAAHGKEGVRRCNSSRPPACLRLEAQVDHAVCLIQHHIIALVEHCRGSMGGRIGLVVAVLMLVVWGVV